MSSNTIKEILIVLLEHTLFQIKGEVTEDSIECPLAELGLINLTYTKGEYEIQRGPKLTLSDKIFEYALNDYWSKQIIKLLHLKN